MQFVYRFIKQKLYEIRENYPQNIFLFIFFLILRYWLQVNLFSCLNNWRSDPESIFNRIEANEVSCT